MVDTAPGTNIIGLPSSHVMLNETETTRKK